MSIAVYCRDAPIKPPYFYTWRRRLREQQPCAGGFLELIPRRLTEAAASGIRIRLGAKLAIEVARGFDSFTHLSVVEALSGNYSKLHNGLTAAIRIHLYHLYLRYVKILRRPVRHHPFRPGGRIPCPAPCSSSSTGAAAWSNCSTGTATAWPSGTNAWAGLFHPTGLVAPEWSRIERRDLTMLLEGIITREKWEKDTYLLQEHSPTPNNPLLLGFSNPSAQHFVERHPIRQPRQPKNDQSLLRAVEGALCVEDAQVTVDSLFVACLGEPVGICNGIDQ